MYPASSPFLRICARSRFQSVDLQSAIFVFLFAIVAISAPQLCGADTRVEAYRGEPFGIGRVTLDLQPGASTAPASDDRVSIAGGRPRCAGDGCMESSAQSVRCGAPS